MICHSWSFLVSVLVPTAINSDIAPARDPIGPGPGRAIGEAGSFPARVERLRDWVTERGGFVSPKVEATEDALDRGFAAAGGERGLFASTDIAEGERLILVPSRVLVHQAFVVQNPLVTAARQALDAEREKCSSCSVKNLQCLTKCRVLSSEMNNGALEQIELAVWIAQEIRKPASEWRPWLDLLPKDFGSMLVAHSEPFLREAFGGTDVLEKALELQSAWQSVHEVLSESVVSYREQVSSYEDFRHARLLVLSRLHGLPNSGDSLVPFADLLNHDANAPTWWGPSSDGDFQLIASRPIPAGTPITCSYGAERSNKEFLLHYGFVPGANPKHSVALNLELDRRDHFYGVKRQALLGMDLYRSFQFNEQQGFAASGRPLRYAQWDTLTEKERGAMMIGEVLAFLRVAVLEERNLKDPEIHDALLQGDDSALERLRTSSFVIDEKVELRVATRLEATCKTQLKALGGESGRTKEDMLQALAAMKNPASEGADLENLAATSVAYLELDRRLHVLLQSSARSVQSLIKKGSWPLVGSDNGLDPTVRDLVAQWAQNFVSGAEAAASPSPSGEKASGTEL